MNSIYIEFVDNTLRNFLGVPSSLLSCQKNLGGGGIVTVLSVDFQKLLTAAGCSSQLSILFILCRNSSPSTKIFHIPTDMFARRSYAHELAIEGIVFAQMTIGKARTSDAKVAANADPFVKYSISRKIKDDLAQRDHHNGVGAGIFQYEFRLLWCGDITIRHDRDFA